MADGRLRDKSAVDILKAT